MCFLVDHYFFTIWQQRFSCHMPPNRPGSRPSPKTYQIQIHWEKFEGISRLKQKKRREKTENAARRPTQTPQFPRSLPALRLSPCGTQGLVGGPLLLPYGTAYASLVLSVYVECVVAENPQTVPCDANFEGILCLSCRMMFIRQARGRLTTPPRWKPTQHEVRASIWSETSHFSFECRNFNAQLMLKRRLMTVRSLFLVLSGGMRATEPLKSKQQTCSLDCFRYGLCVYAQCTRVITRQVLC